MEYKQKVYGRRQSFLSKEAEELLKTSNIVINKSNFENISPSYFNSITKGFKNITLEVGSGYGEHVFSLANKNKDNFYIACEVYLNGVASLLKKVKQHNEEINNLIIFNTDARDLVAKLPNNYLNTFMLLFPDPWPKKRHNKRRFLSQENITLALKALKQNGLFRFATDHEDYANYGNKILNLQQNLTNINLKDALKEPNNHIITRYEQKAIDKNSNIYYFDYFKI